MKQQWQALIDIFIERNSQLNLSAIREVDGIYTKHILDSLELNNKITLTP
jgi:16S rRNA G527 N7-methylase RsmG